MKKNRVIPGGVDDKNLGSKDLGVVGVYGDGKSRDIKKRESGSRSQAD